VSVLGQVVLTLKEEQVAASTVATAQPLEYTQYHVRCFLQLLNDYIFLPLLLLEWCTRHSVLRCVRLFVSVHPTKNLVNTISQLETHQEMRDLNVI